MIGGKLIRKLLRKARRDIVPYDYRLHPVARRMHLLKAHGVTLILDVGANIGQYGRELRELGFSGRIVSFEPLKSAYAKLERNAERDPLWTTFNCGIGSSDGITEINVAANVHSSSMLPMLPRHLASAPESSYRSREEIRLRAMDSILPEIGADGEIIFLKSDTQGYEAEVLKGAPLTLARAVGVQMEMSLVPLYDGETLLADMIHEMGMKGFQLMSLEQGFADPATGQLLQADGIFFRASGDRPSA
jgi:FkbM family methyltransferase